MGTRILVLAAVILGIAGVASAGSVGDSVEVEVRSDHGGSLLLYPVAAGHGVRKAYAQAVKGENYSIVVRNRLNRRVGVVVAVDGRNIISGKKSWLKNGERMYILEPYGEGEFKGWRTGMETINRFFFTDAADSYAAAFNDESAMGVIAVAAYPEMERFRAYDGLSMSERKSSGRAAPSASSESAGTGFGREEYSPIRVVDFEPEGRAAEKIYIKYEWRSTLCRKGIISCARPAPPRNRMWDDDDFAPHPPGWY